MKFQGFSESQDIEQLRQAAEQGDAETQFSLGRIYSLGRGVPQDSKEAVKWFCRAAEQDLAAAQVRLAKLYVRGQGTPEDHVKAYAWMSLGAFGGDELSFGRKDRLLLPCTDLVATFVVI